MSVCIVLEDGKTAFSGSEDGTVCKWNAEIGKQVRVMGQTKTPIEYKITEDGELGVRLKTNEDDSTDAVVKEVDGLAKQAGIQAGDVLSTINGTKIGDITEDDLQQHLNTQSRPVALGVLRLKNDAHSTAVTGIVIIDDGRRLKTTSKEGGTAIVYNIETGVKFGPTMALTAARVDRPDSKETVFGSVDSIRTCGAGWLLSP